MAGLMSNGATNLSAVNGFYGIEAFNAGLQSTTSLVLTSTRTISLTYLNAGNAQGVVIGLLMSSAVPDRDVTVTLKEGATTRASKTLTAAQITSSSANATGCYIVDFVFTAPYAVTTAGATWTIEITQGAGAVNWSVATSNGTAIFYAAWCDNPKTFSSGNDWFVCKDRVTVDMTATVKGAALATGDTTRSLGIIVCRSTTPTVANVDNLRWGTGGSYTLTVDGHIQLGAHSGFRAGTSGSPITLANAGTLGFSATPTLGTLTGFLAPGASRKKCSIIAYGEIPAVETAYLANDYISTGTIVTTTPTGWANGDTIYVTGSNSPDTTVRTISSITGTSISFTPSLSALTRYAGWAVTKWNGYGFKITANASRTFALGPMSNFTLSGCQVEDIFWSFLDTTITQHQSDAANSSARLVTHCAVRFPNGPGLMITGYMEPEQIKIEYVNMINGNPMTGMGQVESNVNGGSLVQFCNAGQTNSAGMAATSLGLPNMSFENNQFSANALGTLLAANFTFKNNKCMLASSGTILALSGCANAVDWSGNSWDVFNTGYDISLTGTNININMVGDAYNIKSGVTNFFNVTTNTYQLIRLTNPTGSPTINPTQMATVINGSRFWATNYNAISNYDINWTKQGIHYRTGYGLPDTNVLAADGATTTNAISTQLWGALRIESFTGLTLAGYRNWSANAPFNKTTGNAQGKSITVAVKVLMPHSDFYGGTHTKPTLSVVDNDGTTRTAVATGSTAIQTLTITFTPTTTNTSYTYEVYGASDAASTTTLNGITINRKAFYVLAVDAGVPSGTSVDNTRFSVWSAGQVQGADSTIPTIESVWNVPQSVGTTVTNSMGALLNDANDNAELAAIT